MHFQVGARSAWLRLGIASLFVFLAFFRMQASPLMRPQWPRRAMIVPPSTAQTWSSSPHPLLTSKSAPPRTSRSACLRRSCTQSRSDLLLSASTKSEPRSTSRVSTPKPVGRRNGSSRAASTTSIRGTASPTKAWLNTSRATTNRSSASAGMTPIPTPTGCPKKTGHHYRLPSEAEWEYAARGGSRSAYWWGNDPKNSGEVMACCRGCGSQQDGIGAYPVGSFKPNAFGLYDVHGNVWEWVQDYYCDDYETGPKDGSARTSKSCGKPDAIEGLRIFRGGSCFYEPRQMRSAMRLRNWPFFRNQTQRASASLAIFRPDVVFPVPRPALTRLRSAPSPRMCAR